MLRKKIYKISSVLVAVIIAFSCFVFSVNAATAYNMPIATPTADQFSGYLEVLLLDNSGTTYRVATYSWRLSYSFCIDDYEYDTDLMSSYLEVDTSYVPMFNLDILVRSNTISFITTLEGSSLSIYDIRMSHTYSMSTGYHTYRYFNPSSSNTTSINGSFYVPEQFNIVGYKIYGNGIINSSSILKEQNANWYAVYTENSQQAITDSIDKGSSEIQANQDKNTDKILNGGHDSPSYSSPDTDIADKFASAEGNVMSDAQSQWDKIDDKFVSVITTVRTSKFYRGMLVATKILEEFTGITWLGDIILVAFCLGAFSFVIGMSSLIIFRNSDNIKLAQEKSRAQRSFERDLM